MGALSYQDGAYEYRLMIATAAALACCAIGLVAVTVVVITGDRFEYRPAASDLERSLARSDDNLVSAFRTLETLARSRDKDGGTAGASEETQTPKRRVVRLKSPWCSGVLSHQPFRSCRPRPK